jgi:glutaminyl-peptide cyclotransferase
MRTINTGLAALALILLTMSCQNEVPRHEPPTKLPGATKPVSEKARVYTYSVVREFPHDVKAFTQGLQIHKGLLYESTGGYGTSSVRRYEISTGKLISIRGLEGRYFGEGLTVVDGKVYVLTWLSQICLIFNDITLEPVGSFTYSGEGWGLTTDGTDLYMSNGSHIIMKRSASDGHVLGSITVTLNGQPCIRLNELEWVEGEIWANVWQSDNIVRINPTTGVVTSVIDLSGILPASQRTPQTDVLNGIAYDAKSKAIYVTGKNWPHIYQIKVAD